MMRRRARVLAVTVLCVLMALGAAAEPYGQPDGAGGADRRRSRVGVFDGPAQLVGQDTEVVVRAGESGQISGQDALTYDGVAAQPDELDRWAAARDDTQRIVAAPRYVSPQMTGYQ